LTANTCHTYTCY